MRSIFLFLLLFNGGLAYSQTFNTLYGSLSDSCNQDTILQNLIEFENLGIKEVGTGSLDNTYDWLVSKYQSYGYTAIVEDPFFAFGQPAKNLVVTKIGSVYPNTFVIIDAHYDTKNGPGTNDNGSGTVILLELARLLENIETEYSIKFIHFSVEENGLVGSQHYVNDDVIGNNMDIKIVFNIDEVGGVAGMTNDIIVCERDQSPPSTNDAQSSIMTDELTTCIELYSSLSTEVSFAYSSDYVPFMNNGEIITGLYEKNETPYAHSIYDSLAFMDVPYLHQITKGSMGALAHFAVAVGELSVSNLSSESIKIYPNPSNGILNIGTEKFIGKSTNIQVYDVSGLLVWNQKILINQFVEKIDISQLSRGSYLVILDLDGSIYRQRISLD